MQVVPFQETVIFLSNCAYFLKEMPTSLCRTGCKASQPTVESERTAAKVPMSLQNRIRPKKVFLQKFMKNNIDTKVSKLY
jgi:hypothetical protein